MGCGLGGFAVEYCARVPKVRLVALEWRKKWARHVQDRADKRGLLNLKVIEADARAQVPRLFRPGALAAIHFQFPDPWWKRAHRKRSLLQDDFTDLLFGLLAPGGSFDLRTDVEERAHEMIARLEQAGLNNPLGVGAFHPTDPLEGPSSRERRYLLSGQTVYRARLSKPLC